MDFTNMNASQPYRIAREPKTFEQFKQGFSDDFKSSIKDFINQSDSVKKYKKLFLATVLTPIILFLLFILCEILVVYISSNENALMFPLGILLVAVITTIVMCIVLINKKKYLIAELASLRLFEKAMEQLGYSAVDLNKEEELKKLIQGKILPSANYCKFLVGRSDATICEYNSIMPYLDENKNTWLFQEVRLLWIDYVRTDNKTVEKRTYRWCLVAEGFFPNAELKKDFEFSLGQRIKLGTLGDKTDYLENKKFNKVFAPRTNNVLELFKMLTPYNMEIMLQHASQPTLVSNWGTYYNNKKLSVWGELRRTNLSTLDITIGSLKPEKIIKQIAEKTYSLYWSIAFTNCIRYLYDFEH